MLDILVVIFVAIVLQNLRQENMLLSLVLNSNFQTEL